jgi:hypothetical protein
MPFPLTLERLVAYLPPCPKKCEQHFFATDYLFLHLFVIEQAGSQKLSSFLRILNTPTNLCDRPSSSENLIQNSFTEERISRERESQLR